MQFILINVYCSEEFQYDFMLTYYNHVDRSEKI